MSNSRHQNLSDRLVQRVCDARSAGRLGRTPNNVLNFGELPFYEVGCIRGGRFGAAYPLTGSPSSSQSLMVFPLLLGPRWSRRRLGVGWGRVELEVLKLIEELTQRYTKELGTRISQAAIVEIAMRRLAREDG
jgi:hypothetical protein